MGLENPLHILIVLVVVLMVFGAKRLPEMGKGLGEGMRGFKSALSGESHPEPQTHIQQLTPAEPLPGAVSSTATSSTATSGTADERSAEPVA